MIMEISRDYLRAEMEKVNAHPASFPIFERKADIILLKVFEVPSPGANVIKQEMLSLGGDAVVHKNAVDCKVEKSDIILMGTKKHYEALLNKLEKVNYFGLKELREELDEYFKTKKPDHIESPWGRRITFESTRLMGIINVTPDSFFAGSRKEGLKEVLEAASDMVKNGADILDIGGLSTRPGSEPVEEEEELKRVVPAIKAVRQEFPQIPISVDTYRARVAKEALDAGADIINDISGLQFDENLVKVVAEYKAPLVLMHIKGTPRDMQKNPYYDDVVREIAEYFCERMEFAIASGARPEGIILDPGIGFGKSYEHNLEILSRLKEFKSLKRPLLIGASRKTFIGKALGDLPPEERLEGTLAVTALCALNDVDIVRVHDVRENRRVLDLVEAVKCRRHS